jgi:hypothetical protein
MGRARKTADGNKSGRRLLWAGTVGAEFSVARPDVVRAINQLWLLKTWNRERGAHRVPLWQAVIAEDLSRVAAQLSILQVSGGDGAARFQIQFHGTAIAQAYGSPDCTGKYLDEVVPAAGQDKHLAPYHRALDSGHPVYTIHDVTDRDGRLVHYERLLLPYGREGETVDHILAAFEFISPDGAFDHQSLMKSLATAPVLRLSATIKPQAQA